MPLLLREWCGQIQSLLMMVEGSIRERCALESDRLIFSQVDCKLVIA